MISDTKEEESDLARRKPRQPSAAVLSTLSASKADLVNSHRDLVWYYSNFGLMDSSTGEEMFEKVFQPSVVSCGDD